MERIHFLATGNQARNERYPTIMEFIGVTKPQTNEGTGKEACRPSNKDPRCCNKPSTWQKRHLEEYWRLNPSKGAAQLQFSGSVNNIYKHESEINEMS